LEATGNKIHVLDHDHIDAGDQNPNLIDHGQWVWKGFLRGHSVIIMDNLYDLNITDDFHKSSTTVSPHRITQKQTADHAARCNLNTTVPNGALSSTRYCIANPGHQYLVLRPGSSGSFTVDLSAGSGKDFSVEWLNIADGSVQIAGTVAGGSSAQSFTSRFFEPSVLFLNKVAAQWTLTPIPANNYFQKPDGKVLYFTGSHSWTSGMDVLYRQPAISPPPGSPYPPVAFDFTTFLNWMASQHYNFMRYWIASQTYTVFKTTRSWYNFMRYWIRYWIGRQSDTGVDTTWGWTSYPVPYARPGPGNAVDNLPKFDLNTWNQAYFDRIRERCLAAAEKGIYVDIILFESADGYTGNYHPFRGVNNINGLDADPSGIYTLTQPATLVRQKAFVAKVIDSVNDLDNVIYEIGNELPFASLVWQIEVCSQLQIGVQFGPGARLPDQTC
jgi:hypothetical protein